MLSRFAPWLVLLAVAFAAGHWHARSARAPKDADRTTDSSPSAKDIIASTEGSAATGLAPAPDPVLAKLEAIIVAARTMAEPDARTLQFFEQLPADRAEAVAKRLLELPSSSERDVLAGLLMKRWAALDPQTALEQANAIMLLPFRSNLRATVYETWGRHDPQTAFDAALGETEESDQPRMFNALLAGAATQHPGVAVTLWENTPERFRESAEGRGALERLTFAAFATGRREAILSIIQTLPTGEEQALLILAAARAWGADDPEAAAAWVRRVIPVSEVEGGMLDAIFSAYVRRDPVGAAEWAARQTDERRRTNYVAAAVAEWAKYDTASAETWVNEQPEGSYLDGATYAIATHFIERRALQQAFAWTRRIMRNEARADLLGNLGRIWNQESPDGFEAFLAQTSLNRTELEMLRSKIVEVAPPESTGPN